MKKFILIIGMAVLAITYQGFAQELAITLPQGEGYSIKKDAPSPHSRWELKLVNTGGTFGATERTIISPESFYSYNFPESMKQMEFDPTGEQIAMDASYFEKLKTLPIERNIEAPTFEEGRDQVDAFLDSYNQMLRMAPSDEPIELIIERAAWQYWYNQMTMWEQYIGKGIFLKSTIESSMEEMDFSNRDALNNTVASLANKLNEESKAISEAEYRANLMFLNRLQLREARRTDYKQWLADQKDLVVEFTHNWARRQEGRELTIDGTVYLLSEKPLERLPRNTVNLVTDRITPYDLLNPDGTIKKPIK